jgi:mannose-6-phosphate isomerase
MEQYKNLKCRAWGYYEIFAKEEDYQIKKIVVYPGQRISLQYHNKRSEHWNFVKGFGKVTLNDNTIIVKEKTSIDISIKDIHRVENIGSENLVFVEVQKGEYLGEDDIERLEDDYGRC